MKKTKNMVGPAVRKFRYRRGLSQASLAVKCQRIGWDIGRDVIAKIETQTRCVSDFELIHLSKVLSIPIQYLFKKRQ